MFTYVYDDILGIGTNPQLMRVVRNLSPNNGTLNDLSYVYKILP